MYSWVVLGFSGTATATLIPFTGDFNGDGFYEIGVYNPTSPASYQIRDIPKLDNYTNYQRSKTVGLPIDSQPIVYDVNCDGRDDLVLFKPGLGFFAYDVNSGASLPFKGTGGSSTDVGNIADGGGIYPGCVTYYVTTISSTTTAYAQTSSASFTLPGAISVNATYWRRQIRDHYTWDYYDFSSFVWQSGGTTWGISGDKAFMMNSSESQFIYRPSQLRWYYRTGFFASTSWNNYYGASGDIPLVGFFAGPDPTNSSPPVSNNETVVIFRPSTNRWYLREVGQTYTRITIVHP